ncbi:hypothetical protein PMAYCL1PPCAC_16758 [Pristionchus mayeri]|uniref:Uncharacterized protein n=1 Tax=Pristionchus mayeri TaxID=1317129 RepID=A0AAN5CLD7_9BILA|nr:hypothetical protein PMAYCL1PPCAC_16758 [Pristionchus mayeri]
MDAEGTHDRTGIGRISRAHVLWHRSLLHGKLHLRSPSHWPSVEERRVVVESRVICFAGILLFEYWSPILFATPFGAGSVFVGIWSAMSALHLLVHPAPSKGVNGKMD